MSSVTPGADSGKPSVLGAAREYLARGWTPLPIFAGQEVCVRNGWQKLRPKDDELPALFKDAIGLSLNLAASGLTDIDLDWPEAVEVAAEILPPTLIFGRTTRPKSHALYRFQSAAPKNKSFTATLPEFANAKPIVEILSNHQVSVPPSRHRKDGDLYEWGNALEPAILPAPALENLAREIATAALFRRLWPKLEHSHHPTTLALAGFLGRRLPSENVLCLIRLATALDKEPAKCLRDAESTLRRLAADEPVTGAPALDGIKDGLGKLLVKWWGRAAADREDESEGQGTKTSRKTRDDRPCFNRNEFLPNRLATAISEKEQFIAAPIDSAGKGAFLLVYENGCFSPGEAKARALACEVLGDDAKPDRIDATISLLKELTKRDDKELNPQAMELICLGNGMLRWKTGEILPHSPGYLCTYKLAASYDPKAQAPDVDRFLREVPPADALPLVEEVMGYLLLPTCKYHKAVMVCGPGANGKGTWIEAVCAMIGPENVSRVSLQDISENRFAKAELRGKLLNVYPDLSAKGLEQTGDFKAIVSGDSIQAERKHGHPFNLSPKARLVFSCNELPKSKDTTPAYFRRWLVVPFTKTFEGAKADRNILAKLITPAAKSALLNYALRGLQRLEKNNGFTDCRSVSEAGDRYRKDCDSIFLFASERLARAPGSELGKTEVYAAYEAWCEDEGMKFPASRTKFGRKLAESLKVSEGRAKTNHAIRVWLDLGWRDSDEADDTTDAAEKPDFNQENRVLSTFELSKNPGKEEEGGRGEGGSVGERSGQNPVFPVQIRFNGAASDAPNLAEIDAEITALSAAQRWALRDEIKKYADLDLVSAKRAALAALKAGK